MAKEKLIDIVNILDSCANARKGIGIAPVARVHCNYDGEPESFWFTNHIVNYFRYNEVRKFGQFVPKNSAVAIKMQTINVGDTFEYDQPNKIKRIQHHKVVVENRSDLQNQTIAIADDPILYQYRNIKEFLSVLQQNREDIAEIENKIFELRKYVENLKKQKDTAHQRGQVTKSINELQKEYRILTAQQEDLKNITIYIRKQGEMRYSLIVDTIQTKIKSQNLFDGTTVIINGGPGTGKSTTMIHRLAYLTDTFAIDEDEDNKTNNYKLNGVQRKQLREAIKAQRDWMFFSPSQMLREYLAAAMTKEGLTNTYQKVWNWKDYCRMVMQANYGLIGDDSSKAPFRICFLNDTLFYQGYDIIGELTNFYLDQLRQIKYQLPKLRTDGVVYEWTAIAKSIGQKFEDCDSYNIAKFVLLFNLLDSVYGNDCKKLLSEKNDKITALSKEICDLLEQNTDAKSNIKDLIGLTSDIEESEIEEIVEENEDNETENEVEVKSSNTIVTGLKSFGSKSKEEKNPYDEQLLNEILKWVKAYCHSKVNDKVQLNDIQIFVSEILIPLLGDKYDNLIQKIGEMMIFEQYAQYTRGVKAIMLNGLPARYKKFRTHLSRSKYEGCNLILLRDITQRKQGKELHHQELSLLLGFINTIVKQIKSSTQTQIKHPYIEAYDEVSRPIIGIDEATDFSVCEIYAMQSLLTREFNSLTLCGDMMQRITTYGIKSWEELDGILASPHRVDLKTSYRQSKKLLDVARQIYTDTLNETPTYKAFMKSNKVPAPIVYIDENEHNKIEWISKRISEVYRAYGEQLPSIAIFVNDEGYIPRFIENLKDTEFFTKNNIEVFDGSKDNSKRTDNHICVYPIDVVKGMEFDVVFFHNIDNSSADTEILKRYIYVGVSRAAFFLGITLSEDNEEISKYFEKNKDWFKI